MFVSSRMADLACVLATNENGCLPNMDRITKAQPLLDNSRTFCMVSMKTSDVYPEHSNMTVLEKKLAADESDKTVKSMNTNWKTFLDVGTLLIMLELRSLWSRLPSASSCARSGLVPDRQLSHCVPLHGLAHHLSLTDDRVGGDLPRSHFQLSCGQVLAFDHWHCYHACLRLRHGRMSFQFVRDPLVDAGIAAHNSKNVGNHDRDVHGLGDVVVDLPPFVIIEGDVDEILATACTSLTFLATLTTLTI